MSAPVDEMLTAPLPAAHESVLGVWEDRSCPTDEAAWTQGASRNGVGPRKILQRPPHLKRAAWASRSHGSLESDTALVHEHETPNNYGTAVIDLEPQLDAIVVALQPQLRRRPTPADTGNTHVAATVLRDRWDRPSGEEQHQDDRERS